MMNKTLLKTIISSLIICSSFIFAQKKNWGEIDIDFLIKIEKLKCINKELLLNEFNKLPILRYEGINGIVDQKSHHFSSDHSGMNVDIYVFVNEPGYRFSSIRKNVHKYIESQGTLVDSFSNGNTLFFVYEINGERHYISKVLYGKNYIYSVDSYCWENPEESNTAIEYQKPKSSTRNNGNNKMDELSGVIKVYTNSPIYDKPSIGEGEIQIGTAINNQVTILGIYNDKFYKVKSGSTMGYMSKMWVQ